MTNGFLQLTWLLGSSFFWRACGTPTAKKLTPVLKGPYTILRKVLSVNYETDRPVWTINRQRDIVHVKLRRYFHPSDFTLVRGGVQRKNTSSLLFTLGSIRLRSCLRLACPCICACMYGAMLSPQGVVRCMGPTPRTDTISRFSPVYCFSFFLILSLSFSSQVPRTANSQLFFHPW